jgi:hypothetical protein
MDVVEIKAGQRLRVLQEIDRREGNWSNAVEGTVVFVRAEKTGSWHAHGRDDKLWLYHIRLQKDDGELTTLVVDQHTRCEVIPKAD